MLTKCTWTYLFQGDQIPTLVFELSLVPFVFKIVIALVSGYIPHP